MNVIKLNKKNPTIEFDLTAEESYLLIKSVCITTNNDCIDQWANFISKVKLSAELRHFCVKQVLHLLWFRHELRQLISVSKGVCTAS